MTALTLSLNSAFFAGQDIQLITWFVVANIILGLLVSLLKGTFNFHHLSNFLTEMVLPYIFIFAVFKTAAANWAYGDLIIQLSFIFILLTLSAGIWEKLGHFGLPTPKWLARGER